MADPAVPPTLVVVLGATGDLMQRKMLPAFLRLSSRGELPAGSRILGVARKALDDKGFREKALSSLEAEKAGDPATLKSFCEENLFYQSLGQAGEKDFQALRNRIEALEASEHLTQSRVLYLALPYDAFTPTLEGLGKAGLARGPGNVRVVIEKPFGEDLASAEALNRTLHSYFDEKQVYRIDHYLGKETVQNLMVFRFANMFVESLWDRQGIDHVEVTVAESLGLEGRAEYYDHAGALRDMVQNHVTQILSLVAMEPPATADEEAVRNEKVKVLRSIVPPGPSDVVRGQYTAGIVGETKVPGYLQEPGIPPQSQTETYVALRLRIPNWRWQTVPFFLRTGKRLPAKSTRVVVIFRAPPVSFFQSEEDYELNPDRLTMYLQPQEGFELAFEIKVPGQGIRVQTHRMRFQYSDVFGPLPDGYETLLADILKGDATHFVRADEVEAAWRLYDPILKAPPPVVPYPAGSPGPEEVKRLAEEWGHHWSSA